MADAALKECVKDLKENVGSLSDKVDRLIDLASDHKSELVRINGSVRQHTEDLHSQRLDLNELYGEKEKVNIKLAMIFVTGGVLAIVVPLFLKALRLI